MRTHVSLSLALMGLLSLAACQSDSDDPQPQLAADLRPVAQFLADSTARVNTYTYNASTGTGPDSPGGGSLAYEQGFVFTSSTAGKITQVGVRYPLAGEYVVTLWDATTGAQLAQTTVTQPTGARPVFVPISPVALEANKQYVLSGNNARTSPLRGHHEIRLRTIGPGLVLLPFTKGPLTLLKSRTQLALSPTYPRTGESTVLLNGYVDLNFVAN